MMGSNINSVENSVKAIRILRQKTMVCAISMPWETISVGRSGPNFINLALEINTDLLLEEFKEAILHSTENELGRIRLEDKFAPRTMDLDVIIYDNVVMDTKLWGEAFVALPMAELIPGFVNPQTGMTLAEIAKTLAEKTRAFQRRDLINLEF